MAEARAVIFTGPRSVEVRPVELERNHHDTLYLESELIGISHGTERIIYAGEAPATDRDETLSSLRGGLEYPLKYGYINVGRAKDGTRHFAFYPHQDRFYCTTGECVPLPPELATEDAVFLASMETAICIVHDTSPLFGESVLVCGQGVVGLMTAQLLKRSGCRQVIAVEPSAYRSAYSKEIGCDVIQHGDADAALEAILSLTGGGGVDAAVNLSASASALQLCMASVISEGNVIEASWYGDRSVELKLGTDFHRRRLTIKSSQVSEIRSRLQRRWSKQRRFDLAIALLGELRPGRFITHRIALDQAAQAFELLESAADDVLQIVLDPTTGG